MRPNGFSLIEVLISIAACCLVMMASADMAVLASRQKALSIDHLGAQSVMQQVMDALLSARDSDPRLTAGSNHTQTFDRNGTPVTTANSVYFTANWNITPNTPFTGMIQIVVNLNWSSAGSQRSMSYTTYRTQTSGTLGLTNVVGSGGGE